MLPFRLFVLMGSSSTISLLDSKYLPSFLDLPKQK